MLRVLTAVCLCLLLAAPLAACGGNACEEACDKVESCGGTCSGDLKGECNAKAECLSSCFIDATCDEIKNVFGGPVLQCMAKCPQ